MSVSMFQFRTVDRVLIFHKVVNKTVFSYRLVVSIGAHAISVKAHSKSTLDGYMAMAHNGNPYGECELDFYLQKLTILLTNKKPLTQLLTRHFLFTNG